MPRDESAAARCDVEPLLNLWKKRLRNIGAVRTRNNATVGIATKVVRVTGNDDAVAVGRPRPVGTASTKRRSVLYDNDTVP